MLTVRAPGKLMLSGEWSVLELSVPCIVLAVNRYVNVTIKEAKGITINAQDLNIKGIQAKFRRNHLNYIGRTTEIERNKLFFAKRAIEMALRYLADKGARLKGFEISTDSEITAVKLRNGSTTKAGFGSSAAAVVAIVAAILKLHQEEISSLKARETIYKLSCIAHYLAQDKIGSGFDVASSTYGGALIYKRFDPEWLTEQVQRDKKISDIVESKWKNFEAKPLTLPTDFTLCVGFTGYGASTKNLVLKMNAFREQEEDRYWEIIDKIKRTTQKLVEAIRKNKKEDILRLLSKNRMLLKELSEASGNNLETKELTGLIETANELGASAKFSGAGGGDCAIAVCFDEVTKRKIEEAWKERRLYPLDVKVSREGVETI